MASIKQFEYSRFSESVLNPIADKMPISDTDSDVVQGLAVFVLR